MAHKRQGYCIKSSVQIKGDRLWISQGQSIVPVWHLFALACCGCSVPCTRLSVKALWWGVLHINSLQRKTRTNSVRFQQVLFALFSYFISDKESFRGTFVSVLIRTAFSSMHIVKLYSTRQSKHIDQASHLCFWCKMKTGAKTCLLLEYFSKSPISNNGKRCYSAVTPAQLGKDVRRKYGMTNQTRGRCHLFTVGSVWIGDSNEEQVYTRLK